MKSCSTSPTASDGLRTSFIDSNVKVKTTKEQKVGDTLFGSHTLGVEGHARASGWD
jgi:hypothetical protein